MKNIIILVLFVFMTGCISSTLDPFFNINSSCNSFYDEYKRWPTSENELKMFETKYPKEGIDWNTVSGLSIKKISEDQAYVSYDIQRWYGKDTVSGSVYRPIIKVNINKSDN